MSKVAANNKLPNKSVNRLPYGLFTLRWENNSAIQDICLYRCHCFQHYLVMYFEVNDSYTLHCFNSPIEDIYNSCILTSPFSSLRM